MEYKCPSCGGAITFDSSTQSMKCPYCDTEISVRDLLKKDAELKKAPDIGDRNWKRRDVINIGGEEAEGLVTYVCESCAGEIIGDANLAAARCPYCGNPVIVKSKVEGFLKPDVIIPFKLDKQAAKAAFLEHLKGKFFLPKSFKTESHIDGIKGVYVPFWLFDMDVDAEFKYKGVKVRTWSDKDYDYTERSYYDVGRRGSLQFSGIPVDGSKKMPDAMMESLEPYFYREAKPFQTAYLAGYFADKYDVGRNDSIGRAKKRAAQSTKAAFDSTLSEYTSYHCSDSSIDFSNARTNYAMLPVWILNTVWKDKLYTFMMNGQTGLFAGNLPLDKKKYGITLALVSALMVAVCTLVVWLIMKRLGML